MRDTNDLFLRAAREKFRYPSPIGELTTEQVWDLPLTSTRGASLDGVARAVNTELKAATEDSFVTTTVNPARGVLAAKLDVLKAIIATKQDEAEASRKRAAKAEERRLLMEAIAKAQVEKLTSGTYEELQAKLRALESEGA